MTLLLLLALGGLVSRWLYVRWQRMRFSNSWWRDQVRRECQDVPESAAWNWDELKERKR